MQDRDLNDILEADPRAALIEHLRVHALRTDGPFTLRSGVVSDWYLDARQTTYDGRGAVLVGRVFLGAMDESVTAVGGLTMGADPIAMSVAMTAATVGRRLCAFSVRKEAKGHGVGGRVVGPVRVGDAAAVVEDTATTGTALTEAIGALRAEGIEVVQAITLVDRSAGAAAELLGSLGVAFSAIVTAADLGVE